MKHSMMESFHSWFIAKQSIISAKRILQANPGRILEVGAGKGLLTDELRKLGATVEACDYTPSRLDIVHQDAHKLTYPDNSFNTVVCSNTLEHLHSPDAALKEFHRVSSQLWLSWTPWYSPFGGHEFSPLHYFGKKQGSIHRVNHNLFKTTVDGVIKQLEQSGWSIVYIRPRYWPSLKFLTNWSLTKEWAAWNIEVLCVANKLNI